MDLNFLTNEFTKDGWKNITPGEHLGYDFDLVGDRRYMFTQWHLLVKTIPTFDQATAEQWISNFEDMSQRSKSLWWGRCFMLVLLAENMPDDSRLALHGDGFGLFGVLRIEGGGGRMFLVDEADRTIHGSLPPLPIDVRIFSKSTHDILVEALKQPATV